MRWQRRARVVIAIAAVACLIVVWFALRPRPGNRAEPPPVARTDPSAVVESGASQTLRFNREHEEVRIAYQKLLSYKDGTSKMIGVKVVTERAGGRIFTITGSEGHIGDQQSTVSLSGDVHVTASDGLELATDRATYTEADGIVRAPGDVRFSRGRMSGSGVGFTYEKNQNILTIEERVNVRVAADAAGAGAMQVEAGALQFARNDKVLRFERSMKAVRERQVIEADTAVAHLTADEERIELLELRGRSRITTAEPMPGTLQSLAGRDIDLKYRPDGRTLERATTTDSAALEIAADAGSAPRQISANTIAVAMAEDGTTPTTLTARDNVHLTMPGAAPMATRTVSSRSLDSTGEGGGGLTRARFAGAVQFAERGQDINRTATSGALDVGVSPGFASINDARFSQAVRFVDRDMIGTSAVGRYVLDKGSLELTGSDAANPRPHVENRQLAVDAARIDVTLDGPVVNAAGSVKSVIRAERGKSHIPSMLKQDQPVNVTANDLTYDGNASHAVYSGAAQLWQGETTIKAASITIDSRSGDLNAAGPVTTTTVMKQEGKDGKKEQVRSIGSAKDFSYDDAARRATYTGDAHLSGPEGDTTAARIELYLKESGDEIDRAEAYEGVTLREQNRKTTGSRLTYHADEQRYVVTGTPVSIVDECGRETVGSTLTFFRTTDSIIVDGNEQVRTQSKGKSNCP
jgi:LPS export ABC transporter protein LptC/lipopolysaccharide transport protein LptA